MNPIKKAAASTKKFVVEHKTVIVTTTTLTIVTYVALTQSALKQHNEFLKEHDLYEEFYTPENSY